MAKRIRRIISGEQPDGTSVFVQDELLAPTRREDRLIWSIWGTDQLPIALPSAGAIEHADTRFPSAGGVRVLIIDIAGTHSPEPTERDEHGGPVPGDAGVYVTRDATGMHMTTTVDVVLVLEGEIGLEQDDGAEVVLAKGDVLVQNGARHAWRPGPDDCRLAFVIVGAERDKR